MHLQHIDITPDPVAERLVQEYIEEYDTTYRWYHVRNICTTSKFIGVPPFRDFCGIIHHPDGGYIIFCDTLAKGYRAWVRRHPEVTYNYNNGQCQQFKPAAQQSLPTLMVRDVNRTIQVDRRQILKPNIIAELLAVGNTPEFIAQLYNTDITTVEYISKKPLHRVRKRVDTEE